MDAEEKRFIVTTEEDGRATTGMAERDDVLGALERLLDEAGEGHGGALFVVGPAGLGKTTVLEYAITMAKLRFAIGVGRGIGWRRCCRSA
jgi:flagellar biosynthesis GTPase FlhF